MKQYLILAGVIVIGSMVGVALATIVAAHTAAAAPATPAAATA